MDNIVVDSHKFGNSKNQPNNYGTHITGRGSNSSMERIMANKERVEVDLVEGDMEGSKDMNGIVIMYPRLCGIREEGQTELSH